MTTDELKVIIMDGETYREMVLFGGYIPHEDRWVQWEISKRVNQIDAMIKFIKEYPIDYWCTFNGVGFDGQVIQYILDNYELWYDKTALEICTLVYTFVQNLISDQNYELPLPYKEHYLDIQIIDMYLILHYNNDARRCSLKWCMYSMDEDIELMEVDHGKENLTDDEIEQTIMYWKNDIKATYTLYKYCLGETEHPDYKGKNKIQLRLDLIEEMKLPHIAINWNDVKIGAELNKKNYLELTGIDNKQLYQKVKDRKTRTGFMFKDCYPSYMKFETKEFKEFFKKVGDTVVNLNQKQEFPFSYNGTDYMFAKGGGHSGESARLLQSDDEYMIYDGDVGSMYPNIIRKRQLYPGHLGKKWNEAYISNIDKRLQAKKKYKDTKEKKWDNIQETYKLVLNGNFGRLIDRHDYQYDPYIGMQVTVGGQIDIFMLLEDLEQVGIHVVSLNTDGVTVHMKRDMLEKYHQICQAWEKQVGNDTMGNLEYVEYTKLIQLSVNDYIAVKTDGSIKKKGDFLTSYELHKNKSKCIVPIALEQYYVHGVPVEKTIREHDNIYSFCIAKKASKDYCYEGINKKTGEVNVYNKLIRYYCTTEGEKLWKVKKEGSEKTGPARSQCESTSSYQKVMNRRVLLPIQEYGIDYDWYIMQAKKVMHQIDKELARSDKIKQKQQLSMFD